MSCPMGQGIFCSVDAGNCETKDATERDFRKEEKRYAAEAGKRKNTDLSAESCRVYFPGGRY